ncbi:hypothetical protein BDZ89DRAFT_1225510 [Hymenopellis radicata]|nr:hypothetical protein BDZ89DRAFT_1225510 [Hymenopellis radicata]
MDFRTAPGSPSNSGSESLPESRSETSDEPLLTVRFQAVQDEHGHHVVVGREGLLTKCEDEPIRTPGAVQGFGVLVAVDQYEDTLVVRQVSENSTEILGLSPRYLFSLECFTDTLPEDQAALLWDNIDFLAEPETELSSDNDQDFNHPFRLTGWGAPPDPSQPDATRRVWTCWCAMHRPPKFSSGRNSRLFVMEFELERDNLNPLYPLTPLPHVATSGALSPLSNDITSGPSTVHPTPSAEPNNAADPLQAIAAANTSTPSSLAGLEGDDSWTPSTEDIIESTTSRSKPLLALERLRRITRGQTPSTPSSTRMASSNAPVKGRRGARNSHPPAGGGMMDVFAVMAQINEQLGGAPDLDSFLRVVVGVIKDLTQFHRVLVYQFDEIWNGQVVAELVDWNMTHDLYKGLHFPAGDIPAQASMTCVKLADKVRILYDRDQPTARIVVRSKEDLEEPLDMTHCYLRAMSPIHVKYLGNMGVRASMSVSIMAFGTLWGLVACHSYGDHGMRVSFPVRAMLKLLSQSISRNIERLSYAQRLKTRKLINTIASDNHPTGYIVSNADDLLGLFDADFGILVIGDGAKILGPNQHGQEILIMAEYLRLKQFNTIQASQAVTIDYQDLNISTGLEVVAGLLYVPLSSEGRDFIAFLRKGQPRDIHWAGKPFKKDATNTVLEPRKSFKIWSETVAGRCRAWTDEQLETAGVLALVYGKFIEVWRQKESALQATKLTSLLLSNASHEVRTPLNHIINYLEMALNGPLDTETRDNLNRSHTASKSLLFTINDLLDLTRLESGQETSFNEPFNLPYAIQEAVNSYRHEAERRSLEFILDVSSSPTQVVGDAKKIQTVVQNLTANALKYTTNGSIKIRCTPLEEPDGLRNSRQTAVEIIVADTGCGIPTSKLESIFREFEQVESSQTATSEAGVGLGLAVVARIVEQLGGQLRVDSKVTEGSRFSFLIPLSLLGEGSEISSSSSRRSSTSSLRIRSRAPSINAGNEIDSLVEALSSNHMSSTSSQAPEERKRGGSSPLLSNKRSAGSFGVTDSNIPIRPVKVDQYELDAPASRPTPVFPRTTSFTSQATLTATTARPIFSRSKNLRILIVEDNIMNQTILAKRLTLSGHTVVNTMNGQEALDLVRRDREFDCILMDLNMPILDGYEASQQIRIVEQTPPEGLAPLSPRLSQQLNGRIPIFAVSASCFEQQRDKLTDSGMDGWILKPLNFKRLAVILHGITDLSQRQNDMYRPGCNWESGGWLRESPSSQDESSS